jgi:hypothetical protein
MPSELKPQEDAPGQPGTEPRWTSSAKSGVGTAAQSASQVWFTISHGILDEIYWPEVDRACTRDLGFIVRELAFQRQDSIVGQRPGPTHRSARTRFRALERRWLVYDARVRNKGL